MYNDCPMKVFVSGLLITVISFSWVLPMSASVEDSWSYDPDYLLSDIEMTDTGSMSGVEILQLLDRGSLSSLITEDVNGVKKSAAEIIYEAAHEFELSPRFLLVLLQREQSLVEDDSPSQDQLDWAMGYAVCDDCSKSDPRIAKFKGFGNQVHWAAERIRTNYLVDLESRGYTETGVGPGINMLVDGVSVTPVNFATASLYTYTPHLHGNENFAKIWERWFVHLYLSGSLLQDSSSGGIWYIQNGSRRPITSKTAFYSRFNADAVVSVSPSELERYPIGTTISFPNYSLLRSPAGTVYLIVDDERRGFDSQEAFRSIGFSPDEIVDVEWSDLDSYSEGLVISIASIYPQGALLQDIVSGGIFYVEDGVKKPIMSREILANRFASLSVIPTEREDLDSYDRGEAVLFADGTLVAADGSPDVFVIADGNRHHITNEDTFHTYGWRFDQVVWTNERSVLLHDLADPLLVDTTFGDLELASEL
jgi:hypothetical protein